MNEKDLLELELEEILNVSNDNIVITDGQGIVLKVSKSCEAIYGKDVQSLIGRSVVHLEKKQIFFPSVSVLVMKVRKQVQVMQKTKSGRTVMATGIPIFDKENQLIRIISFSHDLTDLEKLREDYEILQAKMKIYENQTSELKNEEYNNLEDKMIIKHPDMQKIWKLILRVSDSEATVVLLGESGVGKTRFARAIHNRSRRNKGPFIEINCGAIPESLFESELFGYESGAFTGAYKTGKKGLIELANGGTLFLDEIGELPLNMQVKLLKVLEEKKIHRIGGINSIYVDFRLVVATNKDLKKIVEKGMFREDLYYRLYVVPVEIPPLRERREEIFQMQEYFFTEMNEKYQTKKFLSAAAMEEFYKYNWPGNIRELENVIERLVVTEEKNTIYPESLPFVNEATSFESDKEEITLQKALEDVEKQWLTRAYEKCKTTYEMAETLGLSQATIVRRLQKYGINSK